MRYTSLFFFLLYIAHADCRAQTEQSSKEDALLFSLSIKSLDEKLSIIKALNPAERENLIAAVRENKSGAWGNEINPSYLKMLFWIGDPIERKRQLAAFRSLPYDYTNLARLGEPWVIEEVAPDLFREEKIPPARGDLPELPVSHGAAALIVANLRQASIYREEVLQWAKQTNLYDQPAIRGVMRDWWRENERFFKEKNYLAVKPGRALEPLHPPLSPDPQPKTVSVPSGTPHPPLAQAASPAPSPLLQRNPTNDWNLVAVIAALLVCLGIGLRWFKQKKE